MMQTRQTASSLSSRVPFIWKSRMAPLASLQRTFCSHDPPIYNSCDDVEEVKVIVSQEVEKSLHKEKGSIFPEYEQWNEKLASNSEAIVKAERSPDKPIEEVQKMTVEQAKASKIIQDKPQAMNTG